MQKSSTLFVTGLFLSAAASSFAAIAVPTTGVYDSVQTPTDYKVDAFAGVGAITTGSAGETSYLAYTSAFAAAFAANRGGVIQFDGFTGSPAIQNQMTTTYGSNTLTIDRIGGTGNYQFDSSPSTLGKPISGTMYLRSESENFHTFSFSDGLSAVGFTVLSRNSSRTILATVTYFEGGTDSISGEYVGITGNPAGDASLLDDTFFGFTAPAGKTIKSLKVEATATGDTTPPPGSLNYFFAIDDLGYIVAVPEPSTSALGVCGLLGMLLSRRRGNQTTRCAPCEGRDAKI